MQSYQTIATRATASITEKRSEFIATIAPSSTEEEAISVLEEVRAAHRTAAHNVYAYTLRADARQRYSDDGEPAKTAGLPVLSVLTHAKLTDCIIVVTRYFGGTLLGTGGLVRAYTNAAQAAVSAVEILTVRLCVTLNIVLDYPQYEPANRILAEAGVRLDEPVFTDRVCLRATLPKGNEPPLLQALNELARGNLNVTQSEPFYTPF